jgi:type IV pilus assembly protein PilE
MELMIVVAIVGILAGIAYPAYQEYGRRAKRAEARATLLDAAARMERFYSDNNSQYTNNLATANIAAASENGHYNLSIAVGANNQSYTLTAAPSGFVDAKCGSFTYTNQGTEGTSGGGEDCWTR